MDVTHPKHCRVLWALGVLPAACVEFVGCGSRVCVWHVIVWVGVGVGVLCRLLTMSAA
jgi:hypothetical protein